MIGALPTKTSVEISDGQGNKATVPAATPRSAGAMTAAQAEMLATLWQHHQTQGGGTVVIETAPALDTSQFVRRDQMDQMVQALRSVKVQPPDLSPLRAQIEHLERQFKALPAPQPDGSVQAPDLTPIMQDVISGMAAFDERLNRAETELSAHREQLALVLSVIEEIAVFAKEQKAAQDTRAA